jgi:hypothetical protein
MGWAVGWDDHWHRDIGYGVPATCDHPCCGEQIDRGLGYVCGGRPYGGEHGCGLFFCSKHLYFSDKCVQVCERCYDEKEPFVPTPDSVAWITHKVYDKSWWEWREENPEEVIRLKRYIECQTKSAQPGS